MIQKIINEYTENDLAIYTVSIFFLGIPIYEYSHHSSSTELVETLKPKKKPIKIKGFKK